MADEVMITKTCAAHLRPSSPRRCIMALSRSIAVLRSPSALEEEVPQVLCRMLEDPCPQVQV